MHIKGTIVLAALMAISAASPVPMSSKAANSVEAEDLAKREELYYIRANRIVDDGVAHVEESQPGEAEDLAKREELYLIRSNRIVDNGVANVQESQPVEAEDLAKREELYYIRANRIVDDGVAP